MDLEALHRQLAIAQRALAEKDQLIRHYEIAFDLVTSTPDRREQLISDARATVAHWRSKRLCNLGHIERWDAILKMEPHTVAAAIISAADGWGPILRQTSPWFRHEAIDLDIATQIHRLFAGEYGVLTAREMADRMGCTTEEVSEKRTAGEIFSSVTPNRGNKQFFPAFQLNEGLDKSLLTQIIQEYRKWGASTRLLWVFLRSPNRIFSGLTPMELLLGGSTPAFDTLTPDQWTEAFMDVVQEELSRVTQ